MAYDKERRIKQAKLNKRGIHAWLNYLEMVRTSLYSKNISAKHHWLEVQRALTPVSCDFYNFVVAKLSRLAKIPKGTPGVGVITPKGTFERS